MLIMTVSTVVGAHEPLKVAKEHVTYDISWVSSKHKLTELITFFFGIFELDHVINDVRHLSMGSITRLHTCRQIGMMRKQY